jgi:hypothetical protein
VAANVPAPAAAIPAPASAPAGNGLTKAQADAEIATVPDPQKPIARMLPLTDVPAGWVVAKSGEKHLETFNADNLFEKIDGRAESFIQYSVKGMAYAYYHPVGDESNEVQVYIFELADALRALGKYGSEKPDEAKALTIGSEGYTTAGSTLFYSGPYYTQIVSTKDEPKFADFALEIAKRIAAKQKPGGSAAPAVASASAEKGDPEGEGNANAAPPVPAAVTPEALFGLLPAGPGRANNKYVAQDVFGYSFLSDVFMAEYSEGRVNWQGFLRPYATPEQAKAVFEKYLTGAKQDGAEVKEVKAEGADRMVVSSNIGLVDAYFLKGNCVGGANGATDAKPAEAFARSFAKTLPSKVAGMEPAK